MAVLSAAAGMAVAASALPGPAFPNFRDAGEVEMACGKALAEAAVRVRRLERLPPGPRWLAASDDLNAHLEDAAGPIYLLSNVHPDKAVRDATEACELRWQDFFSTLGQNEKLYRAARKVKPRDADRPRIPARPRSKASKTPASACRRPSAGAPR